MLYKTLQITTAFHYFHTHIFALSLSSSASLIENGAEKFEADRQRRARVRARSERMEKRRKRKWKWEKRGEQGIKAGLISHVLNWTEIELIFVCRDNSNWISSHFACNVARHVFYFQSANGEIRVAALRCPRCPRFLNN